MDFLFLKPRMPNCQNELNAEIQNIGYSAITISLRPQGSGYGTLSVSKSMKKTTAEDAGYDLQEIGVKLA